MRKTLSVRLVVAVVLFGTTLAAVRLWQQAGYGTGPAITADHVTGPARELAFVANAVAGTVSVIDIADRRVVATLDVVPDGTKVGPFRDISQWAVQGFIERRAGLNYVQDTDLSPDGRVLYAARGYLGDVAAFDLTRGAILWRTPIAGIRADHMDLSPDGRRLFLSATIAGGNVVQAIDSTTGRILGAFPAGDWPHDVHVGPDGRLVYAASLGDMTMDVPARGESATAYRITVAEAKGLDVRRHYSFDRGIRPFAVTRDGQRLFAQLSHLHGVVAHDLATDKRTGYLDLPVSHDVTEDDWDFDAPHHGLALSSDETMLCLAGRASDYAALVETDPLSLRATVPVGDAPSWAAFAGAGTLCLLSNNRSDDVSIVAVDDVREVARLPVGRGPKHITVGRVPKAVLSALVRKSS